MAKRFRRSFKVAPGVRVNLNSKSSSVTVGGKAMRVTQSTTGRTTTTASVPGTGVSWSSSSGSSTAARPQAAAAPPMTAAVQGKKQHSILVHVVLALFTAGIGNLIYWGYIAAENRRRGF